MHFSKLLNVTRFGERDNMRVIMEGTNSISCIYARSGIRECIWLCNYCFLFNDSLDPFQKKLWQLFQNNIERSKPEKVISYSRGKSTSHLRHTHREKDNTHTHLLSFLKHDQVRTPRTLLLLSLMGLNETLTTTHTPLCVRAGVRAGSSPHFRA